MASIPMPVLGDLPLLGPADSTRAISAFVRSGLLRPFRPDQLARLGAVVMRYGLGPAIGPTVGNMFHPDETGYVDDFERITFRELNDRCDATAAGLLRARLEPADRLGLLARNSAGFYTALVGAARAGLDVGYLNTGFSAAQIAEVCERENLKAVVFDTEFVDRIPDRVIRIPVRVESDLSGFSVYAMSQEASQPLPRPEHRSRHIILTSGTTGRPKGAARTGGGIDAVIAILTGFGFHTRRRHLIAAPMFHAWGWSNMMFTVLLSSTIVNERRFDAERTLALIERERCEVIVAVPVMLQRIMNLPEQTRRKYDTSSLETIVVSGSALSGELANSVMDAFGNVVYNLYGSTEAAFATVASPADLRAAPGCAGRPLPGVRVQILDDHGNRCPVGVPGNVYVGSGTSFEGYTSGEDKQRIEGLVSMGDLGWFDRDGRLFVGARSDDMVVTGGENVYPVTVENELIRHPDVLDVAVVGQAHSEFGQVVVAHVVARPGSDLSEDGLRTWARAQLAPFQVPYRVVFHDDLPRNETGKVLKRTLVAPEP